MTSDVTDDLFHNCAIWAYWEAMKEGKQGDSNYVKKLAYSYYEGELARENADKA